MKYINEIKKYLQSLQEQLKPVKEKIKVYKIQFLQSQLWQSSVQRWEHLSKREQYLVGGAFAVVVITLIYQIILLPIDTAIESDRQAIIKDQELLVFMESAAPRILAARGEIKPTENISIEQLLPIMENTLKKHNLLDKNLSELNLIDNEGVHLQFAAVDFNVLLLWLVDLRQKYGLSVNQFSATPSDTPGIVNAELQIILVK